MNSKQMFVLCTIIIFFSIQQTSGMFKRFFHPGSSGGPSSSPDPIPRAKYDLYTKKNSVRPRQFFEVIDRFETMEVYLTNISESKKNYLLKRLDIGLPLTDVKCYTKKLFAMQCAYSCVSIYMLYHTKQMYADRYLRSADRKHTLSRYSKYMHRILLIDYMLGAPIVQSTWFTAIYIDALHNDFDQYNDITFMRITKMIVGPIRYCHSVKRLDTLIVELKYLYATNLYDINWNLVSRLGLSGRSRAFLPDLFGSEHRFDVYSFFFTKKHIINELFAPPKLWFETYENSLLERLHRDVMDTWKTDSFVLCKYADAVKDLVLMTTYFALLKHCRFLLATWYILIERVNLIEPSLQPSLREERKKLIQIPLPTFKMIFYNLNSAPDIGFLPDIEANLNNDDSFDQAKLAAFVERVVAVYNSYAKKVGASKLDYTIWKDWPKTGVKGFEIQNQFLFETPNSSYEKAIMENVDVLKSYYGKVLETLSPTDFAAIEYLASVEIKPKADQDKTNYAGPTA